MFRVFLVNSTPVREGVPKDGLGRGAMGKGGGAAKEACLSHVHPFLPCILLENTTCYWESCVQELWAAGSGPLMGGPQQRPERCGDTLPVQCQQR